MPRLVFRSIFGGRNGSLRAEGEEGSTSAGRVRSSHVSADSSRSQRAKAPLSQKKKNGRWSPPQPRPLSLEERSSSHERPKSLTASGSWDECEPPCPQLLPPASLVPDAQRYLEGKSDQTAFPRTEKRRRSSRDIIKEAVARIFEDKKKATSLNAANETSGRYPRRRREKRRSGMTLDVEEDVSGYGVYKPQLKHRDNSSTHSKSSTLSKNGTGGASETDSPPPARSSFSQRASGFLLKSFKAVSATIRLNRKFVPTYYLKNSESLPEPDQILNRLGHSLDSKLEQRRTKLVEQRSLCVVWDLLPEETEPEEECPNEEQCIRTRACDNISIASMASESTKYRRDSLKDKLPKWEDYIDATNHIYEDLQQGLCKKPSPTKELEIEDDVDLYGGGCFLSQQEQQLQRMSKWGRLTPTSTLITLPENIAVSDVAESPLQTRLDSPYPRRCRGFRSMPGSPTPRSPALSNHLHSRVVRSGRASPEIELHDLRNIAHRRKGAAGSPLTIKIPGCSPTLPEVNTAPAGVTNTPPSPIYAQPFATAQGSAVVHTYSTPFKDIYSLTPTLPSPTERPPSPPVAAENGSSSPGQDNIFFGRDFRVDSNPVLADMAPAPQPQQDRHRDSAYFSTDESTEQPVVGDHFIPVNITPQLPSPSTQLLRQAIEQSVTDSLNRLPELVASEVNRQVRNCLKNSTSEIAAEVRKISKIVSGSMAGGLSASHQFLQKSDSWAHGSDDESTPRYAKPKRPSTLDLALRGQKHTYSYSCQDLLDEDIFPARCSTRTRRSSRVTGTLSYADLDAMEDQNSAMTSMAIYDYTTSMPAHLQHSDHSFDVNSCVPEVEVEGDIMELPYKHHMTLKEALTPLCRDLSKSLYLRDELEEERKARNMILKLNVSLDQIDGDVSDTSMEWDYFDQQNGEFWGGLPRRCHLANKHTPIIISQVSAVRFKRAMLNHVAIFMLIIKYFTI